MVTATPQDDAAPVLYLRPDVWRREMTRHGYRTISEQAEAAGVCRQKLSAMLNGHIGPGRVAARRLVRASRTKPSQLFQLADA